MSLANCNVSKAAAAIHSVKDRDNVSEFRLVGPGLDAYLFDAFHEKLGECRLNVSATPNTVVIEASVNRKHPIYGHPKSKYNVVLLETESNETYINAARLALDSLAIEVERSTSYIDMLYKSIFKDETGYQLGESTDSEVRGTPAYLLDYNLTNRLPDDWLVKINKEKDKKVPDSKPKYMDIDLGDVDIARVSAVVNFFCDMTSADNIYVNNESVNKMMLRSVTNAINWVLSSSGSKERVDTKTVLAALMADSLESKHSVIDPEGEFKFADDMQVNVPETLFDLMIIYRNHARK